MVMVTGKLPVTMTIDLRKM